MFTSLYAGMSMYFGKIANTYIVSYLYFLKISKGSNRLISYHEYLCYNRYNIFLLVKVAVFKIVSSMNYITLDICLFLEPNTSYTMKGD